MRAFVPCVEADELTTPPSSAAIPEPLVTAGRHICAISGHRVQRLELGDPYEVRESRVGRPLIRAGT